MCTFITAVLKGRSDDPSFRRHVEKAGLAFEPIENRFVQRQLRADERYYRATRGHCDCGTALYGRGGPRLTDERLAKKAEGFHRKGWSKARIERWRGSVGGLERPRGRGRDREQWVAFLRAALGGASPMYIGLLVHDYRASLHDEQVRIVERRPLLIEVFAAKSELAPDVLYEITAGPVHQGAERSM